MTTATAHIKARLLELLLLHRGRTNGITGKALAEALEIHDRQVRDLITELRMEPIAICGKPNTGYFVPEHPEELAESLEYLKTRAMTSLRIFNRQKRARIELSGQLSLRT